MFFEVDEVSVLVERRPTGLMVVLNVPASLAGPATEMLEELRWQLGPGGSTAGVATATGSLAGLIDGARVSDNTCAAKEESVAA